MVRAIAGGQGRVRTGRIVGPTGTPGVLIGQMIGGSRWNGALTNIAPSPNNLLGAVSGAALWVGALTVSAGATPAFQADFTALSALPADISFSRASNAMVTDSTGARTYAPNNLQTQSNTFSDSVWAKTNLTVSNANAVSDPVGGTAASTLTATANNGQILGTASGAIPAAPSAINSIWIKRRTGSGTIQIYQPGGTPQTVTVTGSWQQFSTSSAPAGGGTVYLGVILATSGDAVDVYSGTLSAVTYETALRSGDQVITTTAAYYGPRFDYAWNGSAWVAKGLLIEEQRTNLLKDSGNLATASWSNASVAQSVSSTLGADNSSFMTLLSAVVGSGPRQVYNNVSVAITSGGNNALSVDFKKTNHNYVWLNLEDDVANHWATVVVDLSTGAVTQTAVGGGSGTIVGSPTVTQLRDGIVRVEFIAAISQTTGYLSVGFAGAATGNTFSTFGQCNVTMAGTETFLCQNAQLSPGSTPTSYIPTTTAAVTRSQDVLSLTGAADTAAKLSSASAIVEVGELPASVPASGNILASSNHWALIRSSSDNKIWSFAFRGQTTGAVLTWTGINRAGNAYGAASSSVSANGSAPLTGTGSEDWASDGLIYVGGSSGDSINGHIRSLAIYNVRLSDTELQTKSVVGAAF